MTIKQIFKLSAGAIGAMAISMPAQAASFTGFTFDAKINNPSGLSTGDIFLESVNRYGKTISGLSDFSYVTDATLTFNGDSTLGPSSTDRGDTASNPNGFAPTEFPSTAEVVAYLGNNNLSNIIDTERDQRSVFELEFDDMVNTFYLFERGYNSSMTVEAIGSDGSTLDSFKIGRQGFWTKAGYEIDTTEIGAPQGVGAYGLTLSTSVNRVRIINDGITDNGPDYKIIAAQVPEPGSMAALALLGGGALLAKRRKQAAA